MSLPFIQIGQCGNQVGRKFYQIMFNEGTRSSDGHQSLLQTFFTVDDPKNIKAKAFSIDMQPKVVQKNLKMKDRWGYDKRLSLVQQQGSGNNWAYGCHSHGPKNKTNLQQIFQHLAQRQDYISGFVQIQSMAGGTGSGIGSYIVELLNQNFNKIPKFVISIMPHLSGQVILQSYNAILSLATLYPQADGIFIMQNDQINEICNKIMKQQKTSLEDINEIMGRNLASIFFPTVHKNVEKIYSIEQNGFNYSRDLISNLFYDPRFKLCSIKTGPHGPKDFESFNSDTWQSLESDMYYRKKTKSHAQMLIARGPDHPANFTTQCPVILDRHRFYNYSKSITLLDNGQQFYQPLEQIMDRGYNMLKQNAYLYQYEKYGISKQQFLQCFSTLENVQTNYCEL